jgi:hypothetical protein
LTASSLQTNELHQSGNCRVLPLRVQLQERATKMETLPQTFERRIQCFDVHREGIDHAVQFLKDQNLLLVIMPVSTRPHRQEQLRSSFEDASHFAHRKANVPEVTEQVRYSLNKKRSLSGAGVRMRT